MHDPIQTKGPPDKASNDADRLREVLKRCSAETVEAACAFRDTGEPAYLPTIVTGVVRRFVENDLRPALDTPRDDLRLVEDLGLDSLTLMEIVLLTEDALNISFSNDELTTLRTLGDVHRLIATKARPAQPLECECHLECPNQPPHTEATESAEWKIAPPQS